MEYFVPDRHGEAPARPHWTTPDGTLHEIYHGHIFVGNRLLGEISYDSGRPDLRWKRCSYAMFCKACGEIWARVVMNNSRGEQQSFDLIHAACEHHPDPWDVPGTLLVNHLEYLLDLLPPEALIREFQLHMKELAP